jgi:hypothetical protein
VGRNGDDLMPFRSETGGFVGNGNMGDFIDQIVETFLIDAKAAGGLGWTSHSHTGSPTRSKGSSPDFEFYFSRGGSPAQVPIWCMQTNSRTLRIYSGNDIDTNFPSFDQPGNPVNEPDADPPADQTSGTIYQNRCLGVTSAPGSYDGYWVFGGETAEYCHVVLKVNSRQYRHFHVGLLDPLVADLHPDTFYVTGHHWAFLSPDDLKPSSLTTNSTNIEHQPYDQHNLPFSNNNMDNVSSGKDIRSHTWLYCPNYGTFGWDWWLLRGDVGGVAPSGGGTGPTVISPEIINYSQPASARFPVYPAKSIGTVNTNIPPSPLGSPEWDYVRFGCGGVSGYADAFGAIPWACEQTFTTDGVALIPIYVLLPSDFESGTRWAPIGRVPDVYRVNMKSLDAEQEISIGSDTYVVFPMINKDANNTVSGEGYSGYEGLAYRKITANAT